MSHEQTAIELGIEAQQATTPEHYVCKADTRQGDVPVQWTGEADASLPYRATPEAGVIISAGLHGEHRLIAPAYAIVDGVVHLPQGGWLVHTDVPEERHGTLTYAPGAYRHMKLREMSLEGMIQEVRD
jgi:hypothetical protein